MCKALLRSYSKVGSQPAPSCLMPEDGAAEHYQAAPRPVSLCVSCPLLGHASLGACKPSSKINREPAAHGLAHATWKRAIASLKPAVPRNLSAEKSRT